MVLYAVDGEAREGEEGEHVGSPFLVLQSRDNHSREEKGCR